MTEPDLVCALIHSEHLNILTATLFTSGASAVVLRAGRIIHIVGT